jgi:peptidoglycan/LPS O-acetylase OafA/YrhL
LDFIKGSGNDAVMVFFVLSGFVIAYVADNKNKTFRDYFIGRAARLYSVVIPAVVLTVVIDFVGVAFFDTWPNQDGCLYRIFADLLFIHEIWFEKLNYFSNGPFWSIGYEFWYYMVFAAILFLRGRIRVYIVVLVSCFIGPKIMVLFPVWLAGALTYRIIKKIYIGELVGGFLFLGSLLGYCFFKGTGAHQAVYVWSISWFGPWRGVVVDFIWHSRYFLCNYIVGLLVCLNFLGFYAISARIEKLIIYVRTPVRWVAGLTFGLYLFHWPLLQLFCTSGFRAGAGVFGSLAISLALAFITERHKITLNKLFLFICDRLKALPTRRFYRLSQSTASRM